MNTEIQIQNRPLVPFKLNAEDIHTLTKVGVIPADTPASVVVLFARFCLESGLSPFKRQVHIIRRGGQSGEKYTIQTGIDGYRATADRTGLYAGNDGYSFDEGLTEYEHDRQQRGFPKTATAIVYKMVAGQRVPFSATARWDEYSPKDQKQAFMWLKMPYMMLGKCAEALALRKAFPNQLSGTYTSDEMGALTVQAKSDGKEDYQPCVENDRKKETWGDGKWRDLEVHWGTAKLDIKGRRLGEIAKEHIKAFYFLREVWQPKPYKGRMSPADVRLREALDVAHQEYTDHKEKAAIQKELDSQGAAEKTSQLSPDDYYPEDQKF